MEHRQKPDEKTAERIAAARAETVEILAGALFALLLSGRAFHMEASHQWGKQEHSDDVTAA